MIRKEGINYKKKDDLGKNGKHMSTKQTLNVYLQADNTSLKRTTFSKANSPITALF